MCCDTMKTNASTRFLLLCGLFVSFTGTLEASLTSEPTVSSHCTTETCIEHTILRESGGGDLTEAEEAAIAYQCCMNENSSYELDNLKGLLKDRGIPDWPMTQRSREEYHVEDSMDASALEAFFQFEAVQDASDPTKYMLLFVEASSNTVGKSPIHVGLKRFIDQYNESSPATLLKRYLQRNGVLIHDGINIYIAEPKYFELVFSFIKNARRYQVKNYEGWKIIASLAHLVSPVRLLHQEVMRSYELPKKDKEEICAEAIAGKGSPLEGLVYRAYVERKFPLKAKKYVRKIALYNQIE